MFVAQTIFVCCSPPPVATRRTRFRAHLSCGSGIVPVLLSEVSSAKSRGAVGSIHQLMINLGILCSGLLGYALVEDVPHGWRYVQGFIVVPAVVQVCAGRVCCVRDVIT